MAAALALMLGACARTSQDSVDIPLTPTLVETASDAPSATPSPRAIATDTPRPTRTPTTTPGITPTLDPAALPGMRIAFVRSKSGWMLLGEQEIWLMNADGSNQRLVARHQVDATYGIMSAFSADGCLYAATDELDGVVFDVQTGKRVTIDEGDSETYEMVSNFAWSPDSTTLTYYRGTAPDLRVTIPELRQIRRLADGSWSAPQTIPLDPSGRAMLPAWALADGRILTQMYNVGTGFSGVSYITDLRSGTTQPLTFAESDQVAVVSDCTPDGHIVFGTPRGPNGPLNSNMYVGQITASGAITDVVIIPPPPGASTMYPGQFTPDQIRVLAIIQHGLAGGTKEYGMFTLQDGGTTSYTTLLPPQPLLAGASPLGSQHAVVSVTSEIVTAPGEIWLLALDGSVTAALTDGFLPMGLPICEK